MPRPSRPLVRHSHPLVRPSRNLVRHSLALARQTLALASHRRTLNFTEKAATGLFRWATTNHIRPIEFIPGTTFLGSLGNILLELLFGILTAVLTGAIAYVMIAYGLPLLLSLLLE